MTSADYHPGPAFDVLGKLRAAEAAISRVRALADEWATHTDDPRAYAAARIIGALDGDS